MVQMFCIVTQSPCFTFLGISEGQCRSSFPLPKTCRKTSACCLCRKTRYALRDFVSEGISVLTSTYQPENYFFLHCITLVFNLPSFTPPVRATVGEVRYSIEIDVGGE